MAGDQDTQSGLIAGVPEMILMETFRKMSPFAPAFEIQFVGKIKYFTGNCRLSGPQGKKKCFRLLTCICCVCVCIYILYIYTYTHIYMVHTYTYIFP